MHGLVYIVVALAAGCVSCLAGGLVARMAIRSRGESKLERALDRLALRVPNAASSVVFLSSVVCAFGLWVLIAPAGAVHDPLRLARRGDARQLPTKFDDVLQLACGLALAAAGLLVSWRALAPSPPVHLAHAPTRASPTQAVDTHQTDDAARCAQGAEQRRPPHRRRALGHAAVQCSSECDARLPARWARAPRHSASAAGRSARTTRRLLSPASPPSQRSTPRRRSRAWYSQSSAPPPVARSRSRAGWQRY